MHSALQHDVIVNAANPDYALVQRQGAHIIMVLHVLTCFPAERVAKAAVGALRASRKARRNDDVSVPTWTGRTGAAGMPRVTRPSSASASPAKEPSGGFFGGPEMTSSDGDSTTRPPSARDILAGFQSRALASEAASSSSSSSSSSAPPILSDADDHSRRLLADLVAEMNAKGGTVTSQQVVRDFGARVTSENVPLFRSMLKQVAVFQRPQGGGIGLWTLKPEFRGQE